MRRVVLHPEYRARGLRWKVLNKRPSHYWNRSLLARIVHDTLWPGALCS